MKNKCFYCQAKHQDISPSQACPVCQVEVVQNQNWFWGSDYRMETPPVWISAHIDQFFIVVHFDYQNILVYDRRLPDQFKPILDLPLLPLTKQFLDNLPNTIANLRAFA